MESSGEFFRAPLPQPPIARSSSVGVQKKPLTSLHLETSDSGTIPADETASDVTFKIPATPKPKGSDITVTTTVKERVVQTRSPFTNFVEIPTPDNILLREGQYFMQDTISGVIAILDRKAPESEITKVTSTSSTASVAASSTAKAAPTQSDQHFFTPERDEWDHEEVAIERMQRDLDTFAKKCIR